MWKVFGAGLLLVIAAAVGADDISTVRIEGLQFDAIAVVGDVEVEIRQGAETSLSMRGDAADVALGPFENRGDRLILGYSREHPDRSFSGLKFRVVVPELASLDMSGSGDVYVRPLTAGSLSISTAGPGRIRLYEVQADSLDFSVGGSGDIQAQVLVSGDVSLGMAGSGDVDFGRVEAGHMSISMAGSGDVGLSDTSTVTDLNISIAGAGSVNMEPLNISTLKVSIVGAGSTHIGVVEFIEANIIGSGDISYLGSPEIDPTILGAGDISARD